MEPIDQLYEVLVLVIDSFDPDAVVIFPPQQSHRHSPE
jgi:LmbE family N-acetylglucosaminyl deacetylase